MSEPHDPFEQRLAAELHAAVDGERAPASIEEAARRRAETAGGGRHRRAFVGAGAGLLAAAAAVLLVVLVVADSDDDPDEIRTVDDRTTTTDERPSTDASSTTLVGSIGEESTTTTAPPEPEAQPELEPEPEAPEPACVDGFVKPVVEYPEGQWEWFWSSQPQPNDPITIRVCVDDVTPAVGQEITLTVVADDPDAEFKARECLTSFWWETDDNTVCRYREIGPHPYLGPPPKPDPGPEVPGHIEGSATHVYDTPGARSPGASVITHDGMFAQGFVGPYESAASASIEVVVHE